MKIKPFHRKPASIANARWAAYAAAGAASAFAGANSSKATIHYSGIIGRQIAKGCYDTSVPFQLDQPGDSIRLRHTWGIAGCTASYGGYAFFGVVGRAGNGVAGFYNACPSAPLVSLSKLNHGQFISRRPFLARNSGILGGFDGPCNTYSPGQFNPGDVGYIGFKFNNGSGDQYGWVRVRIGTESPIDYDFWLIDYAYGDVGDRIRAGQTSSNEVVPGEGSLGWLALGAAGLLAWRKRRSRAAQL